jgi:hypothetical protein
MIDETTDELPLGREVRVEPGVFLERRCFLAATASALASFGFLPAPAYAHLSAADSISFDEFLAQVLPAARRLVADSSTAGQDIYLKTLAEHAVKLSDAPKPSWNDSGQSLSPGTFIGANGAPNGGTTEPFVVLHWRMEPGTRVEAHAHTYGNVCTLGLEGEVQVSNFEMEGERDFDVTAPFIARRTVLQTLGRKSVNLVSLDRNYIHGTVAGPGGGRGLDITTRIKPRRPGVPYLRLERRRPGAAAEFDAVWTDLSGMKGQDASLLGGA